MGSFKTGGLNISLSIAQTACEALSFLGGQAQELGDAGAAACKAKRAVLTGKGTRKSAKVNADKQYDVLYQQFRDEQRYHRAADHLKNTPLKDNQPLTRSMLVNAKINLCDLEDLEDLEDYDDIPEEQEVEPRKKKVKVEEPDDEDEAPPVRKKKAPPVESTRPKKVKGARRIVKATIVEDEFDQKHRYN